MARIQHFAHKISKRCRGPSSKDAALKEPVPMKKGNRHHERKKEKKRGKERERYGRLLTGENRWRGGGGDEGECGVSGGGGGGQGVGIVDFS